MVISLFLVFLGFFVVFYSSAIDFVTTYLPEKLVKIAVLVGLVGWFIQSLLLLDFSYFFTSLKLTLVSFLFGGILYYTRSWASGDMWLMAVASALLGPAFPNFWPSFFIYSLIWSGILGLIYFLYYFITRKLYKKYAYFSIFVVICALFGFIDPFLSFIFTGVSLLALLLLSKKDIDSIFIIEKRVRALEEDDWLMEDLILKKGKEKIILKSHLPVGKKEVELAKKYGKGKTNIKSGVPMTPAFSLALINLLTVVFA